MEKKFWISKDKQSELGSWTIETADEDIWKEMEESCTDQEQIDSLHAGEIVTGDWTE